MILDENLFSDANDINLLESFNIIADGYAPNEYDKEWAIDDINNVQVDINDVIEYHVNEDADYFTLTFKDGTKKAWYIHSGMYIPDEDLDESLKESFEDEYNNCFVEFCDGKPQFAYDRYRDASRGVFSSKMGDSQFGTGIHEYTIKYLKDGTYYDVDDDGNPIGLENESLKETFVSDDKRWQLVDKIKQLVSEGHIDKDDLIDRLLQWFYQDKTFIPFLISNNIFSENEIDDVVYDESLKEDWRSEPMWGTIYYYQDNKKKILDHADFDSGKDLYNELKDFYTDPHYKDCECIVGGNGWSCSLKDFLNEYESTNESLKEDVVTRNLWINAPKYEALDLLTAEEAEKLPNNILNYGGRIGSSWWLKTPGKSTRNASYVEPNVGVCPCDIEEKLQVRPVLITSDVGSDYKLYSEYYLLGDAWVYIGDNRFLYNGGPSELKCCKFDTNSNNYETSELKAYVDKWWKWYQENYNLNESLKEDFDEVVAIEVPDVNVEIEAEETKPEGPAPGADTGITDLLLSLINDENSTIQTYNSFKASLEDHADFDDVINDIVAEEYNHVGMLQTLLRKISPNSVTIDAGEEEAEDILTKEDNDSLAYGEIVGEIDDSFDNGFGGIFA